MRDGTKYYIVVVAGVLIHVLYFLGFYGITIVSPARLRIFSSLLQFVVAFILLIRYNPYITKPREPTEFDVYIIFTCAVFIVITIATTELYSFFVKDTIVDKAIHRILPTA